MRHGWLLLTLAIAGSTAACTSRDQLNAALAEAKAVSAEKDSLLNEVLETTKFVNDLNGELARAKVGVSPVLATEKSASGAAQDRAAVLGKIKEVVARLNESEEKLNAATARAKKMGNRNARLLAQLETAKQTIADLKATAERQEAEYTATIERQKVEIAALTSRVDTMTQVNAQLVADKTALTDTVSALNEYKNTVYYAVGTKKELVEKGILEKEGSKFLFFGGTHMVPARHLDPAAFTRIDKTKDLSIALPREDKNYKIVSRQSPEYLAATSVNKDGKVHGALQIESAEEFWAPSKFLIVVED
jgi:flagellar biosynthesis/type III secretory pathway chaperone